MEQTVYIDLFFIINFSMDFLCFFLASSLLSRKFNIGRTILASLLGGVYACVDLFLAIGGVWGVLLDITACLLMSIVAIRKKGNLREVLEYSLVFTACSILLGGAMTALFSLFNKIGLDKLLGSEDDSDGISVWLFAALAVVGGLISFLGGRCFKKKGSRLNGKIELTFDKKTVILSALCDSGNLLTDPMTSKPCIVADRLSAEAILPYDIALFIRSGGGSAESLSRANIRVIPAQTVNGSGMLYAMKFDKIRIDMGKGWSEIDALVALTDIGSSAGGAKALVPSVFALGAP